MSRPHDPSQFDLLRERRFAPFFWTQFLGAGNRDPRHYADPDAFLVERNPVDHLSFGYGPHGCAGQGLARLEAHAIIGSLATRVERLVVGEARRVPSNITRSIDARPVLEVVPA